MRFLGTHACEEALATHRLQVLYLSETAWDRCRKLREAARAQGVVLHRLPQEALDRKAAGQRCQGVLGEGAELLLASMDDLTQLIANKKEKSLLLALDGIEDPGNLGAILRSAAAAGVDGVLLPERRSAPLNETVLRASAGQAQKLRIVRVVNLGRALEELKEAGAWIYGMAAGSTSCSYLDENFSSASVLVLGAEGRGLHQKIAEKCDRLLCIPMEESVESLNVSAAAAVALFRVRAVRADPSRRA